MTFDEFYNKYKGQKDVGNTAANKGECVGLSSLWMDNFGIAHVYGHAKDLYANAKTTDFAKIPNTPDAIVQKGDIVVWSANYNGTYGHTGVATGKADINTFECFEQNDPLGSTPHLKTYNYAYVTGWLRPKKAIIDTVSVPKEDFERLVRKSSAYDFYCDKTGLDKESAMGAKLYSVVEDLKGELLTINKSLEKVEAKNTALRDQVTKALSNVCPDPATHTSNNSNGHSGEIQPPTDSNNNRSNTSGDNGSGDSQHPIFNFHFQEIIDKVVDFIKSLFGRK